MTGAISLVDYAAQTQDDMRGGLIQKITNESVFMRVLRFVPVDGFKYLYGEQATLGGIAFRKLNGSYTADAGVVNPKEETLAILGGLVKTDVQLANVRGGVARTNAIMAKMRKAGLFFDKYVIDGDPATVPDSFYGLKTRLVGNQLIYPTADASNGGALVLGDVDRLLDAVAGPNESKVLVMRKAERTKMKQLVVASAGGASVADVGKTMDSYDGAKIELLDEDCDEAPVLPKTETRGSSNVTSSMYCIRPGGSDEGEWVQGLIHGEMVNHMPQGAQGTQMYDLIEMLGGLAVFHGRAAARLAGIL
jgi:hypothetical protein